MYVYGDAATGKSLVVCRVLEIMKVCVLIIRLVLHVLYIVIQNSMQKSMCKCYLSVSVCPPSRLLITRYAFAWKEK